MNDDVSTSLPGHIHRGALPAVEGGPVCSTLCDGGPAASESSEHAPRTVEPAKPDGSANG